MFVDSKMWETPTAISLVPSCEQTIALQPGLGTAFVVQVNPESSDTQKGSPVATGMAKSLVPSAEHAIAPHSMAGIFAGSQVFPESVDM
jgi:hypothetical protein